MNHDHAFQLPVGMELPSTMRAPGQARATMRQALDNWGLSAIAPDAEQLVSEVIANAAEHSDSPSLGLTIRPYADPGGRRGVLCTVSDASLAPPQPRHARPDSERGRGLQIVAALATSSGVVTSPHGKTAWFTLTAPDGPEPIRGGIEAELEAGA